MNITLPILFLCAPQTHAEDVPLIDAELTLARGQTHSVTFNGLPTEDRLDQVVHELHLSLFLRHRRTIDLGTLAIIFEKKALLGHDLHHLQRG